MCCITLPLLESTYDGNSFRSPCTEHSPILPASDGVVPVRRSKSTGRGILLLHGSGGRWLKIVLSNDCRRDYSLSSRAREDCITKLSSAKYVANHCMRDSQLLVGVWNYRYSTILNILTKKHYAKPTRGQQPLYEPKVLHGPQRPSLRT